MWCRQVMFACLMLVCIIYELCRCLLYFWGVCVCVQCVCTWCLCEYMCVVWLYGVQVRCRCALVWTCVDVSPTTGRGWKRCVPDAMGQWCSSVVPAPAATALPGNLLETRGSGSGLATWAIASPVADSDVSSSLSTIAVYLCPSRSELCLYIVQGMFLLFDPSHELLAVTPNLNLEEGWMWGGWKSDALCWSQGGLLLWSCSTGLLQRGEPRVGIRIREPW